MVSCHKLHRGTLGGLPARLELIFSSEMPCEIAVAPPHIPNDNVCERREGEGATPPVMTMGEEGTEALAVVGVRRQHQRCSV